MFGWFRKRKRNPVILGDDFLKALGAAGLIPDKCVRVEVRAGINEVTGIHFECRGDERLIGEDMMDALAKVVNENQSVQACAP
jgi:uncharacterized protein YggE